MFLVPRFILDHPWLFGVAVLLSLVGIFHLGRALGKSRGLSGDSGVGLIDGAIFALVGLLLAFTFTSAANRFEVRRDRVVAEANAIGTAQLRLDLLPADVQPRARALLDAYVERRLAIFARIRDLDAAKAEYERSQAIQRELWALAVTAGRRPDALPAVNTVLLPALNQMFDIGTERLTEMRFRTPIAVFVLLWGAAMLATGMAGHASAAKVERYRPHLLAYSLLLAASLYAIVDLEFPRAGVIRVDSYDAMLKGEIWPAR